ncbi:hypothetical protein FRC09_014618 [Ceratobasidium sp. 395]|nr:hypothetical protein FRC09_014618 [Ceratobasidium sp. 395]
MTQEANSSRRSGSPQDVKPDMTSISLLDSAERDQEFYFLDGNIHLRVENRVFFVHQFKLVKFRKVEKMVMSHNEIILEGSMKDFQNVLRISYASFDSLVRFDPGTPALISALRIATIYDHPQLRAFAIRQLEAKRLRMLDYLRLARDFDVPDWEKSALNYLVSRESPITEAEAEILGTKLFVAIVIRREDMLRGLPLKDSRAISQLLAAGQELSGGEGEKVRCIHEACEVCTRCEPP